MTVVDNANYRDFSKKRDPISFGLNGENFECRKALTPKKLQMAMIAFRSIKKEFEAVVDAGINEDNAPDLLDKIASVLVHFLKAESFERLQLVLNEDEPDEPVDVQQLMEILQWVLEKMMGRPTTPSSDSTPTSPSDGTGTSLTAGALPVGSILLDSRALGS